MVRYIIDTEASSIDDIRLLTMMDINSVKSTLKKSSSLFLCGNYFFLLTLIFSSTVGLFLIFLGLFEP